MYIEALLTLLLGFLAFQWGRRMGRRLLRRGATANNLFQGNSYLSLLFLGIYIGLLLIALYAPQFHALPLEWRVSGMRVTWTLMRVMLLAFCGIAFTISWKTARQQVIAVVLLGAIGLTGFTSAEAYFLAPIYNLLEDNLRPNGVFLQTSNSSCAPSALAHVLRLWGLDATESSVAKLAGTSRLGTSMPQLIVAARELGMDGIELAPTWEQMRQINRPGVLATWLYSDTGRNPHAIALVGMSDDTATIADSAFGKIFEVARSEFEEIWRREYVPIFRSTDLVLLPTEVTRYLQELGFLTPTAAHPRASDLKAAIQAFQRSRGITESGELDPVTRLMLSGPFLKDVPTLQRSSLPSS